jgi:hypothetical protein
MDEGQLNATLSVLGSDETTQSVPTPTFTTDEPFGAGMYVLSVGGSPVTDTDTLTFSIDDAPEPQFRIKSTKTAQFVKYGERAVTAHLERDFEDRTDYDAFKALTAQAIKLEATRNATTDKFTLELKSAVKESYEIAGLSGQADLIRANIDYQGVYDNVTSKAYEMIINTDANITFP